MSDQTATDELTQKLLQRAAPSRADFEDLVIVPIFAVVVALAVGALVMLATAVEAEVSDRIDQHTHLEDENGRRQVVRNG